MLNSIAIIGRLVREPELRYTTNGTPVTNFTLAVERNFENKQGEKDVDFIKVVTWRGLAESCAEHLGKGRMVAVSGRLQIKKNKNNDRTYINPEVVADNVQFLDWPDNDENKANSDTRKQATNNTARDNEIVEQEDEDFETPF